MMDDEEIQLLFAKSRVSKFRLCDVPTGVHLPRGSVIGCILPSQTPIMHTSVPRKTSSIPNNAIRCCRCHF
jgi:hypothetical protein